jgi:hypothetical protein
MKHNIKTAMVCLLLLSLTIGCKKSILDEKALTFLSPDALRDKASYEAVLVGLHAAARNENFREDGRHRYGMDLGTDVMRIGDPTLPEWKSYPQELTPTGALVNYWWNWGFLEVLPRANAIISNVQRQQLFPRQIEMRLMPRPGSSEPIPIMHWLISMVVYPLLTSFTRNLK